GEVTGGIIRRSQLRSWAEDLAITRRRGIAEGGFQWAGRIGGLVRQISIAPARDHFVGCGGVEHMDKMAGCTLGVGVLIQTAAWIRNRVGGGPVNVRAITLIERRAVFLLIRDVELRVGAQIVVDAGTPYPAGNLVSDWFVIVIADRCRRWIRICLRPERRQRLRSWVNEGRWDLSIRNRGSVRQNRSGQVVAPLPGDRRRKTIRAQSPVVRIVARKITGHHFR